ncbi:MAG: hypothetical protein EBS01_00505 [Verrucomicrobia bacterium]|nr:hypothetical protein [Verrucomicrobiota bacterium]
MVPQAMYEYTALTSGIFRRRVSNAFPKPHKPKESPSTMTRALGPVGAAFAREMGAPLPGSALAALS